MYERPFKTTSKEDFGIFRTKASYANGHATKMRGSEIARFEDRIVVH